MYINPNLPIYLSPPYLPTISLFSVCFCFVDHFNSVLGFPGGSDGKVSAYNSGDPASIPGWGRSPGEGNGNPLQYSCLENPMDGGT